MDLVVFFLAALAAIATAVAVVAQKNPFVSALALLGNLVALAVLMLLLEAQFVAVAQIIVYAGAVMVMFLFVIAYVGPRGEVGPGDHKPAGPRIEIDRRVEPVRNHIVEGRFTAGGLVFKHVHQIVGERDFHQSHWRGVLSSLLSLEIMHV